MKYIRYFLFLAITVALVGHIFGFLDKGILSLVLGLSFLLSLLMLIFKEKEAQDTNKPRLCNVKSFRKSASSIETDSMGLIYFEITDGGQYRDRYGIPAFKEYKIHLLELGISLLRGPDFVIDLDQDSFLLMIDGIESKHHIPRAKTIIYKYKDETALNYRFFIKHLQTPDNDTLLHHVENYSDIMVATSKSELQIIK